MRERGRLWPVASPVTWPPKSPAVSRLVEKMAGTLAVDFKGVDQVYSGVGADNSDRGDCTAGSNLTKKLR